MSEPITQLDLAALERAYGSLTNGTSTDPFRAEAAKVFMVPEDQVTKDQRDYVKRQAYRMAYTVRT